jgi:hypothetical protein
MENKILTALVGTTILLTSIVLGTPHVYAQTHYQTGYNDGCAGNVVPGPHTSEYKRGYADGQAACSQNGGGSSPPSDDGSSPPSDDGSSPPSDDGSSPPSGGSDIVPQQPSPQEDTQGPFDVTVYATTHSFGVSQVHISVHTENGYNQAGNAATDSPPVGLTFHIPPNQGSSIHICIADRPLGSIFDAGNCQDYRITGHDFSVSMPAGGL